MEEKKSPAKGLLSTGIGFLVGVINGFLGAGGGMLAVPLLKSRGLEQKQAHASAIAVIFPLTLVSAAVYLVGGKVSFGDALPYLPAGAIGAVAGMFILPHIPDKLLRKTFAAFMLWAGFRMVTNK
ncbi:MAG: sulfite exporter TauE/SafE family protein [Oscillospiraceae bacterium]|jgi:uncharacterized membrane protein YfcA|nr:sulfite exporter TauE/SafE family protein [Oscillospiraceae bacterium]